MPESIKLSTELVNSVLAYLGNGLYKDVAHLINGIQTEAAPQIKTEVQDVEVKTE